VNRADWHAHIESVPLTPAQRGRIMAECARLGLAGRAERLAVLARLLGLDGLGSTADLTQGQAGRLVSLFQRIRDRSGLPEITAAAGGGQGDGEHQDGEPVTLAGALIRAAVMICAISRGNASADYRDLFAAEGAARCCAAQR
jgi:hypothetical protein